MIVHFKTDWNSLVYLHYIFLHLIIKATLTLPTNASQNWCLLKTLISTSTFWTYPSITRKICCYKRLSHAKVLSKIKRHCKGVLR